MDMGFPLASEDDAEPEVLVNDLSKRAINWLMAQPVAPWTPPPIAGVWPPKYPDNEELGANERT